MNILPALSGPALSASAPAPLRLFAPPALDVEGLLRQPRPGPAKRPAGLGKHALGAAVAKHRFVLDSIYRAQRMCRISERAVRGEEFVKLNYKLLAKFVGANYAGEVLANLQAWGVIERGRGAVAGLRATSYRLTAAWRNQPHHAIPLAPGTFEQRIRTVRGETWGGKGPGGEVGEVVPADAASLVSPGTRRPNPTGESADEVAALHYANLAALAIDLPAARAHCAAGLRATYRTDDVLAVAAVHDQIRDEASALLTRLRLPRSRRRLEACYLLARLDPATAYADYRRRLRAREPALLRQVDELYNLAQFECDQVALVALEEAYYRVSRDAYGRVHTNLTNLPGHLRPFLYHRQYPTRPLANVDIANSQPLLLAALVRGHYPEPGDAPDDARRFVEVCQTGQFYEYLMDTEGVPREQRAEFKIRLYSAVLFGRENYENKYRAAFVGQFPTVAALVRREKQWHHAALATKLQRIESRLIIDLVVPRLAAAGIWCCTIHDSVVCFADQAGRVACAIKDALRAAHGLECTLKNTDFRRPEQPRLRAVRGMDAGAGAMPLAA